MSSEFTTFPHSSASAPSAHSRAERRQDSGARTPAWAEIKRVLSADLLEHSTWRGLLYLARDLLFFALCLVGLFAVDAWYYLVPLWVLSGMILGGLFSHGHDNAHGTLFDSPRLTTFAGVISFLPSLVPFRQFVAGHNRHHGHTVELDGDFVWHPVLLTEYRAMAWPRRMLHRFYWSPFGAGLYYLVEIWGRDLIFKTAVSPAARFDRLLVFTYAFGLSALLVYAGGWWAWLKVFAVPLLIWKHVAGITLYLQHIHPDIAWHRREEWSALEAQFAGTVTYRVPGIVNFFINSVFLHTPHHLQIRIPFYNLPAAYRRMRAEWSDLLFDSSRPVRDYLAYTRRCKLFDDERGKWVGYDAVHTLNRSETFE